MAGSLRIKYFKREISVLLVCSLLISSIFGMGGAAVFASSSGEDPSRTVNVPSTFTDVESSYARSEILELAKRGILSGYPDGSFGPTKGMTRAEFAKVLALSAGLREQPEIAEQFKDVPSKAWYKGYVGALVQSGITQGTSAEHFSPDDPVTREQLAVFFVRAMEVEGEVKLSSFTKSIEDLDNVSNWARPYVQLAFEIGFLKGTVGSDGKVRFGPKQHAERQALARLAFEYLNNLDKYKELAADFFQKASPIETSVTPTVTATATPAPIGGGGFGGGFPPIGGTQPTPQPSPVAAAVLSAQSAGTTQVEVSFDQAGGSLENSDFIFQPALAVTGVKLKDGNNKVILLTTGVQQVGTTYTLYYKGVTTSKTFVGRTTELSSIEEGSYEGNYTVARGVELFGPNSGIAVIQGTLQLDPGADGELLVQNVRASNVQILSGASHSVKLKDVKVTDKLSIHANEQSNTVRVVAMGNTAVAVTTVESKVILESESGTLGDIELSQGTAGQKVELRGKIDGKVSVMSQAQNVTLAVTEGASVNQIDIQSNATLQSNGLIDNVRVSAPVDVAVQGTVTGTVNVVADNSKLNINENARVGKVDISSNSTLTSQGSVQEVAVTARVKVELNGTISGKVAVNVDAAEISISSNSSVSTIELNASAYIQAEGQIGSFELKSDDYSIVLTGSKKAEALDSTTAAANGSIQQLPGVAALQLNHLEAVKSARGKVNAVVALGIHLSAINNVDSLLAAEAQMKQVIIQAVIEALNKLPDDATSVDLSNWEEASVKLQDATKLVILARSEGISDSLLTGLGRITLVEGRLQALKELQVALNAVRAALQQLPMVNQITVTTLPAALAKVHAVEKAMRSSEEKGATEQLYPSLNQLAEVKARIHELQDQLDERTKAIIAVDGAILQLPAAASLKLADKAAVEQVRALILETVSTLGIQESDLSNISTLRTLEDKLTQLIAAKDVAVQLAKEAITALPELGILKGSDKPAVDSALLKVEEVKRLGGLESEITNITKLNELINKLQEINGANQAAINRAVEAIRALPHPDQIKRQDEEKVVAARALVTLVQEQGLTIDLVIRNLVKLQEAEKKLNVLRQELLKAVQAANEAIAKIPALASLTLADAATVAEAREKANVVIAMGAGSLLQYAHLGSAERRIKELSDGKAEALQEANKALAELPKVADLTLAQYQEVEAVKLLVKTAQSKGALDHELVGLAKLNEAVKQLDLLYGWKSEIENRIRISIGDPNEVTLNHTILILQIRWDLSNYIKQGLRSTDIENLDVLVAAEKRMVELETAKQTAVQKAQEAITKLPSTISLQDRTTVEAARAAVHAAIAAGAAETDITNYNMLVQSELKLAQALEKALTQAIESAVSAIAALPTPASVRLVHADAIGEARKRVEQAIAAGAPSKDIHNLKKLESVEEALLALRLLKAEAVKAAVDAIEALPDPAHIRAEDADAIAKAEAAYSYALSKGATQGDISNLAKLEKVKEAYRKLNLAEAPVLYLLPYEGALYVYGFAEPGGTVRVQYGDQDYYYDVSEDGSFLLYDEEVTVEAGQALIFSSVVEGKRESIPVVANVRAVTGQTEAPNLNPSYVGDWVLTGVAAVNTYLRATTIDGEFIGDTFVREDGRGKRVPFKLPIYLQEGIPDGAIKVFAHQHGNSAGESLLVTAMPVEELTSPVSVELPLYDTDRYLRGLAEPNALVRLEDADGNVYGMTEADGAGYFYLWFAPNAGSLGLDQLFLITKAPGKLASNPVEVRLTKAEGKTDMPKITSKVYEGFLIIEGQADPGTEIEVEGHHNCSFHMDPYGQFTIYSVQEVSAGDLIRVYAQARGKERSNPVELTVMKGIPTEAPTNIRTIYEDDLAIELTAQSKQVIGIVNSAGEVVTWTWTPYYYDGSHTIIMYAQREKLVADETLYVIAMSIGKSASEPTAVIVQPVSGKTEQPLVEQGPFLSGTTLYLRGQSEPNADLRISWGYGSASVTKSDAEGRFEWILGDSFTVGEELKIEAKAPGKAASTPMIVKVVEPTERTVQPKLTQDVYAGDMKLYGTAEPGAIIVGYRENGQVFSYLNTDDKGHFVIHMYDLLEAGEKLTFTAIKYGKKDSLPLVVEVLQPTEKAAAPKVTGPVYESSIFITGTGEVDTVIRLYNQQGTMIARTTVYKDYNGTQGSFTLDLLDVNRGLAVGETYTITASGNRKAESDPIALEILPVSGTTKLTNVTGAVYENGASITGQTDPYAYVALSSKYSKGWTQADSNGYFQFYQHYWYYGDQQNKDWYLVAVADGRGRSEPIHYSVKPSLEQTSVPTVIDAAYVYETGYRVSLFVSSAGFVEIRSSDDKLQWKTWVHSGGIHHFENQDLQLKVGTELLIRAQELGKQWSEFVRLPIKAVEGATKTPTVIDSVYVYEDGFIIGGITEPNAVVEVGTPDGTLLVKTKARYDGYFYLERSNVTLQVDSELWIRAIAFGKSHSEPVILRVKKAEGITPAPNMVSKVIEEDTSFTVYVPYPSELTVKLESGRTLFNAVRVTGLITVYVPGDIKLTPQDVILLQADGLGRAPSDIVRVNVTAAVYQTSSPILYGKIYEGAMKLIVSAENGSYVYVVDESGKHIGSASVYEQDGLVTLYIGDQLIAGMKLILTAKSPGKKTSEAVISTVVKGEVATAHPTVTSQLDGETYYLEGYAEPGSTIRVYSSSGVRLGISGTSSSTGSFNLYLYGSVTEGVYVTAQAYGQLESAKVYVPMVSIFEKTAKPVIRFVQPNYVQGFAEPGATVTVRDVKGYNWNETQASNTDGLFTLYIGYMGKDNSSYQLTAKSKGKKPSDIVEVVVDPILKAPVPYVRDRVYADQGLVSVAGAPNSYVIIKNELGYELGNIWIHSGGIGSLVLNRNLLVAGMELSVTARVYDSSYLNWTVSKAVYVTVEASAPLTPTPIIVRQYYDMLEGKGEPGSEIRLLNQAGDYVSYSVVDHNGRFVFDLVKLAYGSYELKAYGTNKRASQAVAFTYQEPNNKTTAPVLIGTGTITETSGIITGLADSGSYVEITNAKGQQLSSTWVSQDIFRVYLSENYVGGEILFVTAKARGKTISDAIPVYVTLPTESTAAPTVTNTVYENGRWLSGTAAYNAKVWVENEAGQMIGSYAHASSWNGAYSIYLPDYSYAAGEQLYVFAKQRGYLASEPYVLKVASYGARTVTPSVYGQVYEESVTITVYNPSNEAGTIIVKDEAGTIRGSSYYYWYNYYGQVTVFLNGDPLQPNEKLYIYAKADWKDMSLPFVLQVQSYTERTRTPSVTGQVYEGDYRVVVNVDPDVTSIIVRHKETQELLYVAEKLPGSFSFSLPRHHRFS